jgi:ATP-dependent DNA ligase
VACAFDLLMHDGDDLRRRPFRERKLALSRLLMRSRGDIHTLNTPKVTAKNYLRPCVTSIWKASCRSGSRRFINRVRRKLGSRSKIRSRQR